MELRLRRSTSSNSDIVIMAVGVVLAILLGLVSYGRGIQVFALLLGPLGALLVFVEPLLGMFTVAFMVPVQNTVTFGGSVTAIKLLGVAVFVAWFVRKLYRRESWQDLLSHNVVRLGLIFFVIAFSSMLWAEYYRDAYTPLFQLVQLFVWSLLVVDLAQSWERIDRLVKVLLIGASLAAILTIQQFFVGDVRRAGEGVAGVNSTAAILVSLLPFALYLLRARQRRVWKVLSLLYLLLASLGVAVTFSRMSFIMLPLIILVFYWEALLGRVPRYWLVVLTVVVVLVIALVPLDMVQERAQTIIPELQAILEGGNPQTDRGGRGFHLAVGLTMFIDRPLLGVGYGNYGAHFLDEYQFSVPGADRVWDTKRSPHNSHVGLLAELGVVGFVVWIALLGAAARNLLLARSAFSSSNGSGQSVLIQALIYSFLVQVLAYGWYANVHQEKLLWTLLGMSVIVRALAEQQTESSATAATGTESFQVREATGHA